MNKGCPTCGSKALTSTPATTIHPRGRREAVTLYKCKCGWKGQWNQLKKKAKPKAS